MDDAVAVGLAAHGDGRIRPPPEVPLAHNRGVDRGVRCSGAIDIRDLDRDRRGGKDGDVLHLYVDCLWARDGRGGVAIFG